MTYRAAAAAAGGASSTPGSEETIYKRLDFSRLPKYDCVCIGSCNRCVCGGQKGIDEVTKDELSFNTTHSIKTQTRPQQKKTFCKFCYNRRRPASEFKSHFTKSGPEFGAKVVCPLLLQQQCARCGEIGHTPKMCTSEHFLRDSANFFENPTYLHFHYGRLSTPIYWQHPIPPALQDKHAQFEEAQVKTSRLWIMMSGDHSRYTNDLYLCEGGPNWIPFSEKPKTEYEVFVMQKYSWIRRHFISEKPRSSYRTSKQSTNGASSSQSQGGWRGDITQDDIRSIIQQYTVAKI